MTQTVQPSTRILLSEPGKDLTINKPETEDNERLLLSLFDDLNKLCEMLNVLDGLLEKSRGIKRQP